MAVWRVRCCLSKILTLAVLALTLAGCAKDRKPVVPVRGKVFLGRTPANGALVVFHPVGDNDPAAVRPQGVAGSDGAFELTTYKEKDGAPPGEYNVTFMWTIEDPKTKREWSPLPIRYMTPEKSGVRVTIREGSNDLQPITLTR
jgi:hypothetical protein